MADNPLRIVVTGTSGAGKTTFARTAARRLGVPHIELDALNWQPGWRDLIRHDPESFRTSVDAATRQGGWIADGNYGQVRDLLWGRATHVVWLDYGRGVIMARVIRRSLWRALFRTRLWAGNREAWRRMLRPSHPIRWAWDTWDRRRRQTAALLAQPEHAGLRVLRVTRPLQARAALRRLQDDATASAAAPPPGPAAS